MHRKKQAAPAKRRPPKNAWKPGESGNPAGRPIGVRNRATLLAQALLDKDVEAVVGRVVQAALKGDLAAAKMVIDRVVPPARERPISLPLTGDLSTAAGVSAASSAVLQAACDGEILPAEASVLTAIIEGRRKTIETEELERRIVALESKK